MVARTEIAVDVNSTEFQAFAAQFQKYADALKNIPATWKVIEHTAEKAKTHFESAADSVATTAGSMAAVQKSTGEFFHVTTSVGRHWKDLALSTGSVAKNIVGATESLLKWSGIVGIITGAGGLFGFDRLAHSVASQRTGALGVGTDYASRAAFLTNFRRLGDPEGLLGRVSEDVSSMGPQLRRLGLTPAEMKGDTADVAIKALRKGAEIAAKTRQDLLDVVPQLQIFSHEERMRLKAHPEEIEEMAGKFREDRKGLGLSAADQKAYTDFTTQMERASRSIETIFVKGLVRLADPLKNLSAEVIKLVDKFMAKDGPLDELISELGKGIEWLAGEIDKPEFQKTVNDLISGIGSLAASLGGLVTGFLKFANWLGIGTGTSTGASGVSSSVGAPDSSSFSSAPGLSLRGGDGGGGVDASGKRGGFGYRGGGGTAAPISGAKASANAQESWNHWKAQGYSDEAAATMLAMERGESGFNPTAVGDHGRSIGAFQWDATRRAAIARATGIDVTKASHADQLKAEDWESQHGDAGAQSFRKTLMGAGSIESYVHSGVYDFERSGNKPEDVRRRLPMARSALQQYSGQKPQINVRSTPGNNTVDAANAAAAGSP